MYTIRDLYSALDVIRAGATMWHIDFSDGYLRVWDFSDEGVGCVCVLPIEVIRGVLQILPAGVTAICLAALRDPDKEEDEDKDEEDT